MTEQEAEVWAKRLTRIWVSDGGARKVDSRFVEDCFSFECQMEEEVAVCVFVQVWGREVMPPNIALEGQGCCLECYSLQGEVRQPEPLEIDCSYLNPQSSAGTLPQFVDHWLPFFRRGCWLSGCAIEVSAHEKVEWMQGFSAEELEAWNLKL